ncbi:MAG: hypothetical protein ACTSPV_09705 [Candidatus Hodarchaeales archaeon]
MKYKLRTIILALFIFMLVVTINMGTTTSNTFKWHSSVKKGGTFKWKVIEHGGQMLVLFEGLENATEGSTILINVTDDPPMDGNWSDVLFNPVVNFADLYVDNIKIPDFREYAILFFMSPVEVDGDYGWEAVFQLLYGELKFLSTENIKTINYTESNEITYEISNNATILFENNLTINVNHKLRYDLTTGILQEYTYDFSNNTYSYSVIIKYDGQNTSNIPGFELTLTVLSYGLIVLIYTKKRNF